MKKLLNTLYVTTQGVYLHREGEAVAVKRDDETLLNLPIHTISGIVCFGRVSMSPPLMGFCGERGVLVSFLSESGRFLARVQGGATGNILLRRGQYRAADDPVKSAQLARIFIMAKIANGRNVLQRAVREKSADQAAIAAASAYLARSLEHMARCPDDPLDTLRGMEGDCAREYFSVFDHMIVAQKNGFQFKGRSRRPPLDEVNALLSFIYTLLVHDVESALEGVGLDPYCGFLHRDRPGRPSLALDLMEELRPILADRLVLSLINRQQVSKSDFKRTESGAVVMDDAARKLVLTAWQKRKQEEVQHPFLEETAPIGLLPHLQAMLLARFLRSDLDAYPALIWK